MCSPTIALNTCIEEPYGVPSISKILTNAILVYLPVIYKYDTVLSNIIIHLIYITVVLQKRAHYGLSAHPPVLPRFLAKV